MTNPQEELGYTKSLDEELRDQCRDDLIEMIKRSKLSDKKLHEVLGVSPKHAALLRNGVVRIWATEGLKRICRKLRSWLSSNDML